MKKISIITILILNTVLAFSQTMTYQYDNLNRLWKVNYANGTSVVYEYDKLGNRTKKTVSAPFSLSTDASLSDITLSVGVLSPSFSTNTTAYTVNVANNVTNISVTGTTSHPGATVSGNVTNKTLEVGNNVVTLIVTAEDGVTKKTYTITVMRATVDHVSNNIYVTNLNASGAGSLHQAIYYNAHSGDTIRIAPNLAGQTIMLSNFLIIDKNLTIEGNGIILSGNNAHSIFIVDNNPGGTVNVSRVHFINGTDTYGGAIYQRDATLNLQSCIFSNNYGSSYAGAICNTSGNLNVKGCTFYDNSARLYGGAIYVEGTTTLTGNLFYNNIDQAGIRPIAVDAYWGGTVSSGGYNVADGGAFDVFNGTGDKYNVSIATFNTTYFHPTVAGRATLQVVPNLSNYPKTDFYGSQHSSYPTVAGAVVGDYVVTFAMQTGETNPALVVKRDGLVPVSMTPIRQGYTIEWYQEPEYINRWNFEKNLVAQDITLYAKWTMPQTGIEKTAAGLIELYPNPVKGFVILKNAEGKDISVYSSVGNKIFEKNKLSAEETIYTSSWASGVYFVKITDKKNSVIKKLIKE